MNRIGTRSQRTLRSAVSLDGIGMITGSRVRITFQPAPSDSGITFQRVDLPGSEPISAHVARVTDTNRRTTLGTGSNQVTLVEHVLSALAGLRIDNAIVQLDAIEPPGLDGSSQEFVQLLESAGIQTQSGNRTIWSPESPIQIQDQGATLTWYPATTSEFRVSYFLDYGPRSPIARQNYSSDVNPANYREELANCRTFVLEEEATWLRQQGIGKHLTARELVVFGAKGPIENRLRFVNEPARHKLLDLIGDLSLSGFALAGHMLAYRSGHPLNVSMARLIDRSIRESQGFRDFQRAA